MSLLSSILGTPERIWSVLGVLDAHGGRLEKNELTRWLNPRFTVRGQQREAAGDAAEESLGAAVSLGFVTREGSRCVLSVPRPTDYAGYADLVHDRLCGVPGDDPDAVLLEVYAWLGLEVDLRRSTAWVVGNEFADAADAGIGSRSDGQGGRRFNPTKVTYWRRWMTFLGLACDLTKVAGFHPYCADRLSRELARSGLPVGVELPIADVLDVVSARMPYLDGGRITSALPANRGATARQGRHLSSVLSVALRDLHDERRLNLRVMGDATDLRELAPDPSIGEEQASGHGFRPLPRPLDGSARQLPRRRRATEGVEHLAIDGAQLGGDVEQLEVRSRHPLASEEDAERRCGERLAGAQPQLPGDERQRGQVVGIERTPGRMVVRPREQIVEDGVVSGDLAVGHETVAPVRLERVQAAEEGPRRAVAMRAGLADRDRGLSRPSELDRQAHVHDDLPLVAAPDLEERLLEPDGERVHDGAAQVLRKAPPVADGFDRRTEECLLGRISDRRGATVVHRPAGPLAKAYGKRPVDSTIVVLNLMSDGRTWRLAEVSSDEVWAKTPERHKVYLSADGQRAYLADRIGDFDVRQTPEEIETERQRQFMADTEARLRREAEEAEAAAARVEKGEMNDLAQFAA